MTTTVPAQQGEGSLALAGLVLTTLIWAGNIVIARGVNDLIPPVALAFWRAALALLLIAPFCWRPLWQQRDVVVRHWKWLLLMATLSVGCANTFLYVAAHTTNATNIGLINSSMPVMVLLLSVVVLRTELNSRQLLGVATALVGVLSIISEGSLGNLVSLDFQHGDAWITLGVFAWSIFSVLLRVHPVRLPPLAFLGSQLALGTVVILPFYLLEIRLVGGFAPDWTVALPLLYVALLQSIIAFGLWNFGVQRLGPHVAAVSAYLVPLLVALLAWWFLDEAPAPYHVWGGALVLVGVYFATRRARIVPRLGAQQ